MRLASLACSLILVASAALVAVGCSSSGSPNELDAATCPLGQSHYFQTAGCGASAPAPVCLDDEPYDTRCPEQRQVCGCNGVTYTTSCLGAAKASFAAEGACVGDAGPDATTGDASDASDASSSG